MKPFAVTARWHGVSLPGSSTVRDIVEVNNTMYMLIKQEQSTEETEKKLNINPGRTKRALLTKDDLRKVNDPYGILAIVARRKPSWRHIREVKCECGTDICNLPIHSTWCPKYKPLT